MPIAILHFGGDLQIIYRVAFLLGLSLGSEVDVIAYITSRYSIGRVSARCSAFSSRSRFWLAASALRSAASSVTAVAAMICC
ncbi:hypothetical protein COO09_18965 [Rhizorhabdus dicambivorans]|uniref:Uncharacterized protein n=1 Tax=Rhizorhabdus dicambivorans TaxID=1850238 RepID=A0A2A4FPK3_9SPHN|nr:hypothetical protein CMV14_05065 [Rhizorhabdus dicambivorans]PCE40675.1 hypothetical protein COO09_18965 [Rhizorhabdus dicambivorans]